MALKRWCGELAYGSLFTLLLPALLAAWAWHLDRSGMTFWPIPAPAWFGTTLGAAGISLMAISMRALWVVGNGLPMNAYPPQNYVSRSSYALLSHPIYVGFTALVAGISIAANSPAGLWVVTPVVALSSAVLVVGYEGPRLRERFGDIAHRSPLLGLPMANTLPASLGKRVLACIVAMFPWAVAYAMFSVMPAPQDALDLRQPWERAIPVVPWTIWIYSAAYPIALAGPLSVRTNADLRRYVIGAWLAAISGFALMILSPGQATLRPLPGNGLTAWITNTNRMLDADWLALPSFHVVWIVFAAYCFQSRFPRLTGAWVAIVLLIAASCLTTGSHAMADVLAGLLLATACWHHDRLWRMLVRGAQRLANSWRAVEVGPIRIISHAVWAATAAGTGMALTAWIVGPNLLLTMLSVFLVAIIAAGIWGYWLEGGGRLSRPFGYYGYLLGTIMPLTVIAVTDRFTAQSLMAAFACAAPLAQAIGRLRCLVQGCCHGKPVVSAPGICVTHPKSRISALSRLHGVPIHPTQLYSVVANLMIFAILWRLLESAATTTFIGGLYLVLSSLARFAEEHYRGETQTPKLGSLAIYQWIAIALFISGIGLSMVAGQPMHPARDLTWLGGIMSLAAAGLAAFLMSVDFPRSNRRFSQLTVSERQ